MKRLAFVSMVVAAMSASPGAQSLTATRTIGERLVASMPLAPCGERIIAERISEIARVPAGIEFVPGCARYEPPRPAGAEEMSLQGLTAEEALDRLIAIDPRYRWAETEGMIL
jgi:hypothetical protein